MRSLKRALVRIKERVTGKSWEAICPEEYAKAFEKFGGSIHFHPLLMDLISDLGGGRVEYVGQRRNGQLIAAIPLLAGSPGAVRESLIAADIEHKIDIGEGEVLLPIKGGALIDMRWQLNLLSPLSAAQIKGSRPMEGVAFMMARRHAIGDDRLSGKFLYNQRVQWRRFQEKGAVARQLSELSADNIAETYRRLHQLRRGCPPKGHENLGQILSKLKNLLFGHAIFVGDEPAGIDLMFAYSSPRGLLAVGVNGGIDPRFQDSGVGSILHFLNGLELERRATVDHLDLRCCYGKNDAGYKKLWCREERAFFT